MKPVYLSLLILVEVVFSLSVFSQSQDSIQLVGKLEITNLPIHDVWGYVDTISGKKYALLGASNDGMRVIDISTPESPTLVGEISGSGVQAIDIKTWLNFAYLVAESPSVSGKIIDLSDPTTPIQVGTFPGGHNMFISSKGYLYLAAPGLRIFNLNTDPTNPELVYQDNSCQGHDISIVEDLLYDFSDNCGTRIFDVSQPDTLIELGAVPPSGIFHHSGWPSISGDYIFVCDELALPSENDLNVWDISNISNPVLVDSFNDPDSYIHNLYVIDNYALVSYYRAGFRLFDVADPTNVTLMDEFDTDTTMSGPGYGGNFGLFPFWGLDMILASDEGNGLFIFKIASKSLGQNRLESQSHSVKVSPNPTSKELRFEFQKKPTTPINIIALDLTGSIVLDQTLEIENWENYVFQIPMLKEGLYVFNITVDSSLSTHRIIIR